ncbi:hypothetical protein LHJ74_15380 [Streptomyces sp. N2-109]|uniref:Uncharacterized protein n=1 Tax=Streptomyces gossypii TaxID=2883101 RepID=A0ABT2JTV3_9ACTN|nr:hypothetical protein [Streptomyces gossypii]MCT2591271.1 hypothetical protein [Streptomyces gossypii]
MSKSHDEGGRFLDSLNPERIASTMFVATDFESKSHPDMERMIEAADPGRTEALGEKLVRAGPRHSVPRSPVVIRGVVNRL